MNLFKRILDHVISYRAVKQSLPLVVVLRKRHFPFFLVVSRAISVSTSTSAAEKSEEMSKKPGDESRINITNGLLLYYHQYSFYSQKVVMALHEKNLPFESHVVNIDKGEQYQPWYLQINPKGEVPVLQDTGKIIPDSNRIIDYLEDNFSNGDTPRLIPLDQGADVRQRVNHFRTAMDTLPMNVVTMGSLFHPEFSKNPKIPFIAPVRKALANAERHSSENLRKTAERVPEAKEMLLQKAIEQDKKHQIVLNKDEYLKLLNEVDAVLEQVEKELSTHVNEKENWWLCTDRFTVADVALTIVLERLNELGLESRFWTEDKKRPNIERYFQRVKERDSYKKTIPSKLALVKTLITSQNPLVVGASATVAAVALIAGGVRIYKKIVT